MNLEASDLVEVKYEVDEAGEDETDCYPGDGLSRPQVCLSEHLQSPLRIVDCQATGPEPGIEPWEGPAQLRFQFEDKGKWKKRGYTYSERLNKLYIEMAKPVAVRFSLDPSVVELQATVVRALPVYLETVHRAKPVTRCLVHSSPEDPSNTSTDSDILKHLVRTSEPGSVYEENPVSGRLSTVVRTKQAAPGCDYFTVSYQFMCLGSCQGGINRRPICLVLTLETDEGEVLGRQVVELRICTCPLRDMQQDEQKKTKGDCTPVKLVTSLPSVAHLDSTTAPCESDDLYFVPVRGYRNFQLVNKVAESLELNQRELLSDAAERVISERNKILKAKNPCLGSSLPTDPEPSHSPLVKKRRLEVTAAPQQTRYLVPIMPKAKTVPTTLFLSRSNTIVLPPRPPLGQSGRFSDYKFTAENNIFFWST